MKIRRVVAESVPAAVAIVRREMGRDAVILDTRRVAAAGWRRLFRRFDRVELSAAIEDASLPGAVPARRPRAEAAGPPRAAAPPVPEAVPPPAGPAGPLLDLRERGSGDGLRQALFAEGLAPGGGAPQAVRVRAGLRRVVVLVGPTGAGKTTTLAKLAAQLHLHQGWRVALLTADTFRVGAVEQLHAYARLIGLPCEVAPTPGALQRALARAADADVVLVDTSGRGHHDGRRMQELAAFLAAAREAAGPDEAGGLEVHLVLAAPTRRAEVDAILAAHRPLADRLLLTKLDECESAPEALVPAAAAGLALSYCCAGQRVPEDLALAWPDRLREGLGGPSAAQAEARLRTG